ncbi:transcription elongation factor GreA [bacterium]|nr:transcription elongation factor GreA [bacterium]
MQEIIDILKGELTKLEYEFRVELPREISTAVAMGDLRENSEYKAALERQAFVRARIGQLRERLSALSSMSLDRIPTDKAALGSTVRLLDQDSDEEITFELVVPEMSNLDKGLISIASPIGKAIMGSKAGDDLTVTTPSGTREFEVLDLKTVHDKKS